MVEGRDFELVERRATQPLLAYNEATRTLFEFASLGQNVHDLWADLEAAEPECESLLHLKGHGFDEQRVMNSRLAHQRLLDELVLTRSVDTFDIYLTGMLRLVFEREPRVLRSGATMRVDEILNYDSLNDLLSEIIRRQVELLSYKGFFEIASYIRERLGAEFTVENDTMDRLTEAIAVRNIVVHNGGRVNERFLGMTHRADLTAGMLYQFSPMEVTRWSADLDQVAWTIDAALVEKFDLPAFPLDNALPS